MRIKVTYTFEYDANPEHYPEEERDNAQMLADYDYNTDAAWFLTSSDEPELIAVEVFPGYHDTGYGCKTCGCRNAMVECAGLYCIPCYRKAHPDLTDEA
jgi:hypothetical protein